MPTRSLEVGSVQGEVGKGDIIHNQFPGKVCLRLKEPERFGLIVCDFVLT